VPRAMGSFSQCSRTAHDLRGSLASGKNPLTTKLLNVPIAQLTLSQAIELVNGWVRSREGVHTVAFANVHMLVEAHLEPDFRSVLVDMDLACPDGAPVYWLTRLQGEGKTERIAGPEFMPLFCKQSVQYGWKHFVYGGGAGVAEEAVEQMRQLYPGIQIAGYHSPPFRTLSSIELDEIAAAIQRSEADVVWVCLGCPKQERWIYEMRGRLNGKVLLAVGQAVDIMAGRTRRAPDIATRFGMEWVYRLLHNPRRLWKRYLVTNLLFSVLIVRERLFSQLQR
jgi:N-acetylglucosaminyldiphosphoundecaprenol N-acetyl-beta-D-mannosaminyltransferase